MKSLKKFIFLLIIIGAAAYGGHYYYYNHYLQEDPAEIYQESLKYAQGIGVDKDESKSMELLVKAAKAGDVKAQVQLAWTLNQGVRTDKKSDKAAKRLADKQAKEAEKALLDGMEPAIRKEFLRKRKIEKLMADKNEPTLPL